ncbi:MAG TPA: hypothetical protein VEK15_10780 [Vicinamibacteria bacterium]|nr:hypothetical protein [Vicinamibacteria bacterium]
MEPRRVIFTLVVVGFFSAPASDVPLRPMAWSLGVAVVAWASQLAGAGSGGLFLWLACSLGGAALVIRGGSRALHYYLPRAGNEPGQCMRREIRGQLLVSVSLCVLAYLGYVPDLWAFLVLGSAVFFVRYLLLQAKHLAIQTPTLLPAPGIVPSQRWPILLVFLVVGSTDLLEALVGGEGRGRLLITAALFVVLAALVFVLALVRTGWPRSFVRRASFFAGIGLAVGLAAVLVQLEGFRPHRYSAFANAFIVFLVVLPFVRSVTKLFAPWPRVAFLVPPPIFSAMMAPVATLGGGRGSTSGGFLAAFSALAILYHLVVAVRRRARGRAFLVVGLGVLLLPVLWGPGDSARLSQIFLLSLGSVLYAVDLFQRAVSSRPGK